MTSIRLKSLVDEDFVNYKKPSLFLGTSFCDFKCEKECGEAVCQNTALAQSPIIVVNISSIVKRYLNNSITKAIVIGGLEPVLQLEELLSLIAAFREKTDDDIVIYTGYYENEIYDFITEVSSYKNIYFKFGRYVPGQAAHRDEVLGVNLISDNQYGRRIS